MNLFFLRKSICPINNQKPFLEARDFYISINKAYKLAKIENSLNVKLSHTLV